MTINQKLYVFYMLKKKKQVLDLAHNHLDRLNLDNLLSAQLQFLDISCNSRLRVDPRQFQNYNSSRRPLSLVDVSGQNKASTLNGLNAHTTTPVRGATVNGQIVHLPWKLGFSETAGMRERYVCIIIYILFCCRYTFRKILFKT